MQLLTSRKKTSPRAAGVITSAAEVDTVEIQRRALTDAVDHETARATIFREMLANGRAETSSLISSLQKAIGLESAAQKQLRQAQEERERYEAAQQQWDDHVAELARTEKRLEFAAGEIASVRTGIGILQAALERNLGTQNEPQNNATKMAFEIAGANAALPILEKAEQALIENFRTRISEVRAFGVELGVPQSALDSLPTV